MRKQFSIIGDNYNFKRILIERLGELSKVYENIMEHVKNLKKANVYFSSFVMNNLGSDVCLTILQYLLSNNNYIMSCHNFQ